MRDRLAVALAFLLSWGVLTPARAQTADARQEEPNVRKQIVLTPAGTFVEIRTRSKEKVRGSLGAVSGDSFELRAANDSGAGARTLRFDQVKSFKIVDPRVGERRASKILIGVLIGLGVATGIGAAVAAATGQ
jgi:hypothetical protein